MNNELVKIYKDEAGGDLIQIRVDKTLKDLMESKPSSRWDAKFWNPKFDRILPESVITTPMKDYISDIQGGGGGSHFSAFLGDSWDETGKYAKYLHISAIMETGLNWQDAKFINKKTYDRLKTKQLGINDLLLSNKGTVGKSVVVTKNYPKTVVGDTRVIRVLGISSYYLCIFLKSQYGQALADRYKSGVASEGITVDQMKEFPIPNISEAVQHNIESIYKEIASYHDSSMDSKDTGDTAAYQKSLSIAEEKLRDLISRTEEVVRGERKDVL